MSRVLTADSSLDTLKKEAKRWLKALRAGDADAKRRLLAATPAAPAVPGLRDIQLALAREHGLPGWDALREALDDMAMARRSRAERAEIVLHSAWNGDIVAARRILARSPDIGDFDLYTAVATGNLAEVERSLAADPAAATRKGGPLDWEPLLYLAYARLPGGGDHALDIARLLLDRGANPNASFNDGWDNSFTVLTGVIGEGEGAKPTHPQARELALLLIERGTSPYDFQALYNTSITHDSTVWLDFLWDQCEQRDRLAAWREISVTIGSNKLRALDYLLGNAVAYNHLARAEWLLQHGANADGIHAYSGSPLRQEALIYGHEEMADLLVRYGASAAPLTGQAAFQAACMRLDRDAARAIAAADPEVLGNASPMLIAARKGRADIVSLLLELGMNVDVADDSGQRGIQNAVMGNAADVVKLLVAHGADIDRPTKHYGGAMGFAAHFERRDIAEYLAPLSRDLPNLIYIGMLLRVRELVEEDPSLANAVHPQSKLTPLFFLPEDEGDAAEMAASLLSRGADPTCKDAKGITAEQNARNRGLSDAADLMRDAIERG